MFNFIQNKVIGLQCWNWGIFKCDRYFLQSFVKSFTKESRYEFHWFHENSVLCYTLWKILHNVEKRKISSNQLFSNFFSKSLTFTEFLPKMCETKLQQFPHCVLYARLTVFDKNFVKTTSFLIKSLWISKRFDEKKNRWE